MTVNEIKSRIIELQDKENAIHKEIIELGLKIAMIELAPFKDGQEVMCKVPTGRSTEVQRCILHIYPVSYGSYYNVKVQPYKKDGTLSKREFTLYGDISKYITEVKE